MSDTRWKQVKDIFYEALRKEGAERDSYLDEVCAGDIDLRIEVESLLISLNEAKSFLETPLLRTSGRSYLQWQLKEGQEISHYKIVRPIGAGGMGEVYLAEDKTLHRQVAMKLLPQSMTSDRQRLRRFRQEALAVSALNHPNILTIFEADSVDGKYLFAAEYVSGETLRERMKRDRLDTEQTLDIAIQIASALQAAHKAGIVHRDIKPENIMIRDDGYVKVLDFGLAKLIGEGAITEVSSQFISNPSTLMGTASYMSPEQVRRHPTDARSDIFSFGVVLYEMLWGSQAFTGPTNTDVIAAIIQKDLQLPSDHETGIPVECWPVLKRCLEKDRANRYQSVDDLLAELRKLKQGTGSLEVSPQQDAASENDRADEETGGRAGRIPRAVIVVAVISLMVILAALIYLLAFS